MTRHISKKRRITKPIPRASWTLSPPEMVVVFLLSIPPSLTRRTSKFRPFEDLAVLLPSTEGSVVSRMDQYVCSDDARKTIRRIVLEMTYDRVRFELKRRKLTHLKEFVKCIDGRKNERWLFGKESLVVLMCDYFLTGSLSIARREEERKFLAARNDRALFFVMSEIVLPRDILLVILRFMSYNRKLLFGFGLVNWNWFELLLSSWPFCEITKKNVFCIPTLILRSIRGLSLVAHREYRKDELSIRELRYVLKELNPLRMTDLTINSKSVRRLHDVLTVIKACTPFVALKKLCFHAIPQGSLSTFSGWESYRLVQSCPLLEIVEAPPSLNWCLDLTRLRSLVIKFPLMYKNAKRETGMDFFWPLHDLSCLRDLPKLEDVHLQFQHLDTIRSLGSGIRVHITRGIVSILPRLVSFSIGKFGSLWSSVCELLSERLCRLKKLKIQGNRALRILSSPELLPSLTHLECSDFLLSDQIQFLLPRLCTLDHVSLSGFGLSFSELRQSTWFPVLTKLIARARDMSHVHIGFSRPLGKSRPCPFALEIKKNGSNIIIDVRGVSLREEIDRVMEIFVWVFPFTSTRICKCLRVFCSDLPTRIQNFLVSKSLCLSQMKVIKGQLPIFLTIYREYIFCRNPNK